MAWNANEDHNMKQQTVYTRDGYQYDRRVHKSEPDVVDNRQKRELSKSRVKHVDTPSSAYERTVTNDDGSEVWTHKDWTSAFDFLFR